MLRLLSGILLIALVVTTIWWLPLWATAMLAAVAAALAGVEVAHLSAHLGVGVSPAFVATASAILALSGMADARLTLSATGVVVTALVVVAGTMTLAVTSPSPVALNRAAIMVMAPLYVGVPLGAIAWTQITFGPLVTTGLIGLLAISDSAQYYTGRSIGRRKLAPAVSPGKTVEGAIGGLVAAGIAGVWLGPLCLPGLSAPLSGVLALVLATFGIAGNLFESLLKRSAGVKDSSALIPGHGGVLDRIDAYLFAAPVFYLMLRLLR